MPPIRQHQSAAHSTLFYPSIETVTGVTHQSYPAKHYADIKLNPDCSVNEDSVGNIKSYKARVDLQFTARKLDATDTTITIDGPEEREFVSMKDKAVGKFTIARNGETGYIAYRHNKEQGTGCLVRWPWSQQSHNTTTNSTVVETQEDTSSSGAKNEEAVTEEGD
jgi:hypothetical protein